MEIYCEYQMFANKANEIIENMLYNIIFVNSEIYHPL